MRVFVSCRRRLTPPIQNHGFETNLPLVFFFCKDWALKLYNDLSIGLWRPIFNSGKIGKEHKASNSGSKQSNLERNIGDRIMCRFVPCTVFLAIPIVSVGWYEYQEALWCVFEHRLAVWVRWQCGLSWKSRSFGIQESWKSYFRKIVKSMFSPGELVDLSSH